MKKIFTFAVAVLAAATMSAEVIYDWAGHIGTTTVRQDEADKIDLASSVKIHENQDEVNAIKFTKGYSSSKTVDGEKIYSYFYIVIKPAEGGFQAGDVIKFKGAINNADAAKYAALRVRIDDMTDMWSSDNVVNGQLSADDPVEMTYTLLEDATELHAGRYGDTNLFVIDLKVERGGAGTGVNNIETAVKATKVVRNGQLFIEKNGVVYNAQGAIVK